jgi:hypothetical protein
MPTIASSHSIRSRDPHRDQFAVSNLLIQLRVRVALRRAALTARRAEGADPNSTPELALRAHQLTSDRHRRRMARTLRRTVSEARNPSMTRMLVSVVNRSAVLQANDAIQATITRLASPDPVTVKGMAMLEEMITNGMTSPLYGRAEPGAFGRQLMVTRAQLDPTPLDLPIAA